MIVFVFAPFPFLLAAQQIHLRYKKKKAKDAEDLEDSEDMKDIKVREKKLRYGMLIF